eukprot:2596999-Pyramimonas_sp.AAC.1
MFGKRHSVPLPQIHGTLLRREHVVRASARLEILRRGDADMMPLGQCLRRYVLSYALASDDL